jgi:hypothetical protein
MLAELVDHVVGADPDRDWITVAVLGARNAGVVAEGRFAATGDGYREAIDFVDGHGVSWIASVAELTSSCRSTKATRRDMRLCAGAADGVP